MHFDRLDLERTRELMQAMLGQRKWDTSDGLYGVDDLIGGGVAFLVSDDLGPLVVVVIEQVEHQNGRELVIRVARQLGGSGDITERVVPILEQRYGAGCKFVTIYTRRAGLVRKLENIGYSEAAKIMRKTL